MEHSLTVMSSMNPFTTDAHLFLLFASIYLVSELTVPLTFPKYFP
jgi:hypothetical protein